MPDKKKKIDFLKPDIYIDFSYKGKEYNLNISDYDIDDIEYIELKKELEKFLINLIEKKINF